MNKRYKKTYGVRNMMEWQCIINAGNARFHFDFAGGALTSGGHIPAEYTTDKIVEQMVIESSGYFANGKIGLLRSIEIKSELPVTDLPITDLPENNTKVIEVSSVQEAKDYLIENCGAKQGDLRNKDIVIAIAKTNGIQFKFD